MGILNTGTSTDVRRRQRRAEAVVNTGLAFNALLATVKILAGVFGHSDAILADGVNSVSDVVYFVVVKIFVRLSAKPADQEHPYGHHQLESIAALVVGAFVITTGLAIFWDAVNAAFDLATGKTSALPIRMFAVWAGVVTMAVKVLLMTQASRAARRTGNIALAALARDHRNDIFASLGATAGVALGMLGLRWLDPVAGALVAVVITRTGFDILREASSDLMDNVPSREIADRVRATVASIPGVLGVEDIHAHRFGPYLVVNLTIGVDGDLRVAEGDELADVVELTLLSEIDMLRKVYVHYHPVRAQGAAGNA